MYRRRRRDPIPEILEQRPDSQPSDARVGNEGHHRRYPNRERQPSSRLRDYLALSSEVEPNREPQTYSEVMQSKGWQEAIASEVKSIKENETWEVVDLPAGKRTISAKWIFREKNDTSGEVIKLKARLVAKGYEQVHGEDFYETFAPVVRWSTIRTILAVAARKRWTLKQLDVITTFLNGILEEEIYIMEIPEGFMEPGMQGKVVRLKRALYGLKQAPRAWNAKIDTFLVEKLSLVKSIADPNLYYSIINGKYTVLLLYVDDLILAGDNYQEMDKVEECLAT